jgi:hypothetical protein
MSVGVVLARHAAAACLVALPGLAAHAADEPLACTAEPALAQLDFWLGEWEVCAGGERAGRDRVTKVLGGCAIREEWTASDGSRGESLFFYAASDRLWKQVWVTDQALRPGGLKEKHLIARFADGGVRFQGEIALADGRRVLDRTTLRPLATGKVGQRIEISRDGGEHWTPTFDAEYRPASVAASVAAAEPACR